MKTLQKLLLTLMLLVGIQAWAGVYTPVNLPVPKNADEAHVTYITNPDGLLSAEACDSINSILLHLEKTTQVKSLIVVVESIGAWESYDFSMRVGNLYEIGTKDNTGLIVTVATQDHKWTILTGEGLEKYLTDAACSRIGRLTLVPHMKEEDWDGGLLATINDIAKILEGNEELAQWYVEEEKRVDGLMGGNSSSTTSGDSDDWSAELYAALILFFWISCFCVKPKYMGCLYAIMAPLFPLILLIEFFIVRKKKRKKRCQYCGKKDAVFRLDLGDGLKETCWYKCPHCNKDTKKTIYHAIRYSLDDIDSYSGGGGGGSYSGGRSSSSYSSSGGSSRSYGSSGGGHFGGGGASGRW